MSRVYNTHGHAGPIYQPYNFVGVKPCSGFENQRPLAKVYEGGHQRGISKQPCIIPSNEPPQYSHALGPLGPVILPRNLHMSPSHPSNECIGGENGKKKRLPDGLPGMSEDWQNR